MSQDAIEAATAAASAASAASVASKFTLTGSATMLGGWLLSSQFAALAGLVVGALGLAVQWYYRHREFLLREREHALRMQHRGAAVRDTVS